MTIKANPRRRHAEKVCPAPYRVRLCPVIAPHNSCYFFFKLMLRRSLRVSEWNFIETLFPCYREHGSTFRFPSFVSPSGTRPKSSRKVSFTYNGIKVKEGHMTKGESRATSENHVFKNRIFSSMQILQRILQRS